MSYVTATKAQKQDLRDSIVNATKAVERAQEFGQPGTNLDVDAYLTDLQTALTAVGVVPADAAA